MSRVHHTDGARFEGSLAVIGGGKMGEAIVGGLIASGIIEAARITIVEPAAQRRADLAKRFAVATVGEGADALPADVVILAVKPQVIDSVTTALSEKLASTLVISIAAGVSSARLEALLPDSSAVVRVMPNTPALVGEGMSVVSGGSNPTAEQVDLVRALFAALGEAIVLDERHQDAATAISGSGPAYFALVIDALSRAGVRHGLPRNVAQALAVQTMRGTAELLDSTGTSPSDLMDGVSSPGGTTIAALEVLEARAVRAAVADAVSANVARAKELGQ